MRALSSVTLATYSSLCAALLLTACGGNSSGAGNSAGSAGTDATGGNAGTATAGSGGSGTAGSGGSGVAGTGGGGTAGSAGSAGGGAGSAGGDVQVPVVTGTPGEQCSPSGQLACGGVDSKVQLICSGGQWDTISVCSGTTICDPRENSATLGTCVDKDPLCPTPGALSCDGNQLMQCDQTQLGMVVKETCQACYLDRCVGDPCPDPVPVEFVDMTGDCTASWDEGNSASAAYAPRSSTCEATVDYLTPPTGSDLQVPGTIARVGMIPSSECTAGGVKFSVGVTPSSEQTVPSTVRVLVSGSSGVRLQDDRTCGVFPATFWGPTWPYFTVDFDVFNPAGTSVPVNVELDWSAGANCP